jgi:hypothetical protein
LDAISPKKLLKLFKLSVAEVVGVGVLGRGKKRRPVKKRRRRRTRRRTAGLGAKKAGATLQATHSRTRFADDSPFFYDFMRPLPTM